jgi:predicted RNA-binding Zn-ribbon protein involved in translation (DUF1610 family)
MHAGDHCPLCGIEAEELDFVTLGELLKRKWNTAKSKRKKRDSKRVMEHIKFCPKCGSADVFWASGLPQLWSTWECRKCGYRGALVLENIEIAAKLREVFSKKRDAERKCV